ncbi:MAG: TRAP transporter large permease [Lachnospiraceae bacterium]|nr:TRAP transporter large permease [Lachnospiraceae bacterium]
MRILIPILVIVIAAVLGFPIWLAFIVGMIPYYGFIESTLPAQIIIQRFINPCESSAFLAIPLFVTSGVIMNYAGISRRLMDLADGLVGHLAGGLAHCNVLLSVLMGGVSGSAAADAAMESKILVPEMVRRGYDKNFSGAVTIASSLLTPIIPPGMGLIIYAMMTSTSVGKMLAAGYAPGLLGMVLMMIYVGYISKKRGYKGNREKPAAPKELGVLFVRAIWGLLLPFGLILILRIGMATATEVGALCVVYSLIVGVFFYREIKVEHIWPIIKESVMSTATVMVLLCASVPLTFFMTYETIPQKLAAFIINSNMSKVGFLLLINVILIIVGMFMEGSAPLIVFTSLLAPIATKTYGIDPVVFGIMLIFNLVCGNITPPFGVVLYQVKGLIGADLGKMIKECVPFIIILLIVLMVITFIPQFTLFIPNLLY